jgi:DNA invertase Pin-like site-specific DNA recombinase
LVPSLDGGDDFVGVLGPGKGLWVCIGVVEEAVDGWMLPHCQPQASRLASQLPSFKSLADSWADTSNAHGRLMMTVLAGLAEFERELIRARTSAGRDRAKARGVRFGRKPKLTAHQRAHALKMLDAGEPQSAVAKVVGVDQSTVSRLAARPAA